MSESSESKLGGESEKKDSLDFGSRIRKDLYERGEPDLAGNLITPTEEERRAWGLDEKEKSE